MNNCLSFSLADTCSFLKEHDNYIILTHASPDGDTLGSAFALSLALSSMGKNAWVLCPDQIPSKFNYFAKQCGTEPKENATVISVDVADLKLLGKLMNVYADKIELAIDHHISNSHFAKRLYLDSSAAAACECVYWIIIELGVSITKTMADALFTGIATDTGCFKYSNTTPNTHIIASKLMECGIDAAAINKLMFDTKSRARMEIERLALESAQFYFNDKCCVVCATLNMQQVSGCSEADLEGLSVLSNCVEGVLIGVTMIETEKNTFKISLRAYSPYNAAAICAKLGGGGHIAAAGCKITGELPQAKEQILSFIKQHMEEVDAGSDSCK